jgi:hypothetical protein
MIALRSSKSPPVIMTLAADIALLELMIKVIGPLTMIFLRGPTPHLTKSLVNFQIQSFVFLKFEEPALGVPKTK